MVDELNYENIFDKLFPIMRSITGSVIGESLGIMADHFIPFEIEKFASGERIFDWTVAKRMGD